MTDDSPTQPTTEPASESSGGENAPEAAAPVFAAPDRPRGLAAWFAPGGEDDATPERIADERRLLRLLLLMVFLLVAIPTILTVIAFVGQLVTKGGGG